MPNISAMNCTWVLFERRHPVNLTCHHQSPLVSCKIEKLRYLQLR
ncbi:rCG47396 [Rattus norvegicus]|uniref:RCG47396 n=1 Tax=Rattus norvegicus TaxID=10116 RepID=A6I0T0_RAT|nr:rCG47396 [Rattus norvegicus]